MYETYYGLSERPFDLTSNLKYLFLTPSHREALSSLEYGIAARAGVTVLVGEAGTGKTTLIRATLASRNLRTTFPVYLNNPILTRGEFLEFLAAEFRLAVAAATSKTRLLRELELVLLDYLNQGIAPALVIDEAQSMPDDLLEEVRLLANLETPTEKLMPIVLVGQPELGARLNLPAVRHLKQRVALRCELRSLSLSETAGYIAGRVRVAGGDASRLFTREAVMLIHRQSAGIPRTISVICHNALVTGFALDRRPVGADVVREVCHDFHIEEPVSLALSTESAGTGIKTDRGPAVSEAQWIHSKSEAAARGTPQRTLFSTVGGPSRRGSLFARFTGRSLTPAEPTRGRTPDRERGWTA